MNTKPIFFPIIDNGLGFVCANFMHCFNAAFGGRSVHLHRVADSHAKRAMNKASADFLESQCDTMLIIDTDIIFSKGDVDCILERPELELIYGVYPKRELETPPCMASLGEGVKALYTGNDPWLMEMRRAGRGFVRVARSLLERMKEENGGKAQLYTNHHRPEWDFWPDGVFIGAYSATDGPEFLSEDWGFCERAREIGVPVLVDRRITTGHQGAHIFHFSKTQFERQDGVVESWRDIPGWFDYEDCYRKIAAHLNDGDVFVEVGCFMGKSIAFMAQHLEALGKKVQLHVVDTFEPTDAEEKRIVQEHGGNLRETFVKNMDTLGLQIITHPVQSKVAVDIFGPGKTFEPANAVFIDGAHDFESVRNDIVAWVNTGVRFDSILAGHDFDYPEVRQAVELTIAPYCAKYNQDVAQIGRCWYANIR